MAVLKKGDMKSPVLPKETAPMPSLGGEVVVTGLLLTDRIKFLSSPGGAPLSQLLEMTVTDAEGAPVFTEAEWEIHGATNFSECLELFKVARRLSGLDAEVAEKNS